MANACAACNGMGFGEIDPDFGYRATQKPCPKCNPEGEGVAPVSAAPKKAAVRTIQGVDGPVDPRKAEETGVSLDEAVEQGMFTEAEAEASLAEELSAIVGEAGKE